MTEGSKVPNGLDARVAAFGPKGKRMVELVAESVVSGSSTDLAVLMGHGISIDDSLVKTIPEYSEEVLERADELALLLQQVVDAQDPPVVGEGGGSSVAFETLSVMPDSVVTVDLWLPLSE